MALGASGTRIGVLILRQVVGVAAVGVALGLLGAWASARLVAHLLYGVRIADPIVFMAASLAVCLAVVAASAVPLWRARSVDPITTLRSD
jgi:ABC-type antimicrobial peptide transport system permease subunit